ncbi:MAG: hypothetical protein HC812_16040 [Leptolyngbya sp. RL_3_1]|nr:hypothetical protein [Leptolyngbya sp. RL_3_1]
MNKDSFSSFRESTLALSPGPKRLGLGAEVGARKDENRSLFADLNAAAAFLPLAFLANFSNSL